MTSTKLQRFPYVPQVGDEVYYFKQGHDMYVKEVMSQELYEINPKKQCFSKLELKPEELCKVVSLHYVVGPPTLVSLKLAILNPETGANTGGSFTVKYHDMQNVVDFFILKQVYDQSLQRDWRPGSRFRSVIDDYWWSGVLTEVSPYEDEFPDSHFQCFVVGWDTGEVERMSPWDLEPIPDGTSEDTEADASGVDSNNIPITEEEHDALVKYTPQENEWPDESYDTAVERLTRGLSLISELPFAGPFAYPVDVRSYPDYWSVVAYPMDLKAIIDRLGNKYYRRKTALLWDVCQTGRNAKTYNEEDSEIVQNADKLVSILSTFIKDASCVDPLTLCEDVIMENAEVDVEHVDESDGEGQTTEGASSSGKRKTVNLSPVGPVRKKTRRSEEETVEEYSLKEEILTLLNMLGTRSDAEPFRESVDITEFP
ncbi:bromodomain and WD repeat-containing 3, partial, partial [Paramuricea clavata]